MSSQEKEPIFSVKNLKLLTSPFGQNNLDHGADTGYLFGAGGHGEIENPLS